LEDKIMKQSETAPEAFVYMKVGSHAGEDFDSILERKNRELELAGRIFWGYGGTACHPLMQVQPFARLYAREQGHIYLLMEPIDSKANPDIEPAKEFSADGAVWQPLPSGIRVTGSRYALVLGAIQPTDLEVQMDQYVVGIGHSRGKRAVDYLQGRIDKGCLLRSTEAVPVSTPSVRRRLKLSAALIEPFAVLLR
jgi:hypothetical protein